jgi:hypothetical protein
MLRIVISGRNRAVLIAVVVLLVVLGTWLLLPALAPAAQAPRIAVVGQSRQGGDTVVTLQADFPDRINGVLVGTQPSQPLSAGSIVVTSVGYKFTASGVQCDVTVQGEPQGTFVIEALVESPINGLRDIMGRIRNCWNSRNLKPLRSRSYGDAQKIRTEPIPKSEATEL